MSRIAPVSTAMVAVLLAVHSTSSAQDSPFQRTQVEISAGVAFPVLGSGDELTRAREVRDAGQSFFADADGRRRDVGAYPRLFGWKVNVAYYKPLERVDGLMLGARVQNALTGSQPATGGYAEGYFFNFISLGLAAKYYPLAASRLFLKADVGLASVLTKNRFLNADGEQNFQHYFGVGPGGSLGVGYGFPVFGDSSRSLEVSLVYQQLSTRVEVDGIGDDRWNFGALSLQTGLTF